MRKIKIDHQYMAYLLLEILYNEGKVNKETYDAVMAEKERYLRMVKAGENSPSKYRISEPSEIVTEFDISIGKNPDLLDNKDERKANYEAEVA